ncbi:hypothetical protein EVAR_27857_1 [Eumeta japonica]|uniref:HAT C-terminal dimerisation domain-containing protein n=1 Tax=Eumeta variegata TaxID=151549 RepID=A0A4C1VJA8_EUMVA|nr:hypothetical protein EVAR_27857_1 [Eumeta japonica]
MPLKESVTKSNEKSCAFELLQYLCKHYLQEAFPNVSIALGIYYTLPTTSASSERSFRKLKIIKTFLPSTISQERLSGIENPAVRNKTAFQKDFDQLIQSFVEKKHVKL